MLPRRLLSKQTRKQRNKPLKNPRSVGCGERLYPNKFVVFKFQSIAHINTKGQQSDGNFGDHASVVVLDAGIVTADVDDGAEHNYTPSI